MIKNFKTRDVLVLGVIALLLIVPLCRKNIDFDKRWSEDKLWPAVGVDDNTGRVHAGCATFEYLPSKAFDNLEYIKQRENRVYILGGNANIENEKKNGTNMTLDVSNVEENTVVELPYIYYLGYTVELKTADGKNVKLETFESDNGFVAVNLEKGMNGNIQVKYTGTVLSKISFVVSITTLIALISFYSFKKVKGVFE